MRHRLEPQAPSPTLLYVGWHRLLDQSSEKVTTAMSAVNLGIAAWACSGWDDRSGSLVRAFGRW
jgi:hypothetical protein